MSKTNVYRSVISSSIGNMLEWYEYTLYAYFANVISNLFFPLENHAVAMTMTFATFAIGLAARPIGGIIFGYLGDRYSRKNTMVFSMLMMSIPTLCIGLLPTYNTIGLAAPIILVILRMFQGIALGGEFGSSCVYLFESVPENKRGFFGSLSLTGVGCGLVLSSCTILIIESLVSKESIYSYGWRIPFFISVLGSIIALYIRKNLIETEDFLIIKQQNKFVSNPLAEMLKNHKLTILGLFSIFLTTQVSFFIVFIYGKTLMTDFLGFNPKTAGKFILYTVISYTISTAAFGYVSDKINRKYIMLIGSICLFSSALPYIYSLQNGLTNYVLIMSLLMGAFIGMTEGNLNTLVAESFPINIRATSVSFCWNFTAIAFGGVAPIISMWLIENHNGVISVGYYLMSVCSISILGLSIMLFKKQKVCKDDF